MKRVALYDLDSRIPNLALMKMGAWHKRQGHRVELVRGAHPVQADVRLASVVFYRGNSRRKMAALRALYGNGIRFGGSGCNLRAKLPDEVEGQFPDYSLYDHTAYAIGFLTRGCNGACPFCLVPRKEGRLRSCPGGFDAFVPPGQNKVLLLDNNLLAHPQSCKFLREIARRRYAVNFSQSLDIRLLDQERFDLLRQVDSRNARFTRRQFYFSCSSAADAACLEDKRSFLKAFGEDSVTVLTLYGYNTRLSEDYRRMIVLRRLRLIPFFLEYWPLRDMPARMPSDFFDMDMNLVIRLTFRSNGLNWEKYLRWLNRLYFRTFGRYYRPLIEVIYRYNNRERIRRYLRHPHLLTTVLYRKSVVNE